MDVQTQCECAEDVFGVVENIFPLVMYWTMVILFVASFLSRRIQIVRSIRPLRPITVRNKAFFHVNYYHFSDCTVSLKEYPSRVCFYIVVESGNVVCRVYTVFGTEMRCQKASHWESMPADS